jgi:hypothetical protein
LVAFVFAPAAAHGATICVSLSAPSCDSSQATVQAALDAAGATTAADRVVVGAGIFDGPFLYSAGANGGGVELVGQGSQTILTDSPNAPVDGVTVLDLRADGAGNPADVSDLAVAVPANSTSTNPGNIGIDAGGTVQRVDVSGNSTDPGGNSPIGVILGSGETVDDSVIRMPGAPPGGDFGIGVSIRGLGAGATVSDSEITAPVGIEVAGSQALVARTSIASRLHGIDDCTSEATVEDSVFRLSDGDGISVNAGRCAGTVSSLTARHLTIVGPGITTGTGVDVNATNQAPTINRVADVRHTIIRSVATAFRTRTADPAAPATATTSVSASLFEAARVTTTTGGGGAATFLQPQTNLDADPLFADPLRGDFTLLPDSPAIDASFSPPLAADESSTDRAGNPRITDGNGDGVAARDIGAFESPAVAPPVEPPPVEPPPAEPSDQTAPETTITHGPRRKIQTNAKRKRLSFSFTSSEPGSTFACSVDGGPVAPCVSPFSRKFKHGRHTFAVTATDPAGNADQSAATLRFRIKNRS